MSRITYEVEISTSSCGDAEFSTYEIQYDEGPGQTSRLPTQSGPTLQNAPSALSETERDPAVSAALPSERLQQTRISNHTSQQSCFWFRCLYEVSG